MLWINDADFKGDDALTLILLSKLLTLRLFTGYIFFNRRSWEICAEPPFSQ